MIATVHDAGPEFPVISFSPNLARPRTTVRQVDSGPLCCLSVLAVNRLNVLHTITVEYHWISSSLVNKKCGTVSSSHGLAFQIDQKRGNPLARRSGTLSGKFEALHCDRLTGGASPVMPGVHRTCRSR